MRKLKTGWEAIRKIGLALPEVEEGTTYGSPALKVGGKMFACLAIHPSAEPDTLVVRLEFDRRDATIAEDPGTYYLTDHYVPYPCVLVRLTRVREDALSDLLLMGWRFMSTTKKLEVRKRAKTRRRGSHGSVLPSHRAHGRR
jgi:hypothetical protein